MAIQQKRLIESAQTSRPHAGPSLEKRKEARYPTRDAALVRELPPAQNREDLPATVIDVSKSGLRLELERQLWKGSRVEIAIVPRKLVIFGEVRHCRRLGAIFQVGVLIEGLVFPKPNDGQHIHEDLIILYVAGRGLTVPEILRVKHHILTCDVCSSRMAETAAILQPARRRLSLSSDSQDPTDAN